MADDKAIASMNPPEHGVEDGTIAVANLPAKEADDESLAVPKKSGAEPLKKKKKKRSKTVLCCCWCCGITIGVVLLLAIILVILIFAVFKVKKPTIAVTNITLTSVSVDVPITLIPITIMAEADANVSVHNPNVAGMSYENSTVYVFYRGEQVADAPIPAGHIKAHGNEQLFLQIKITLSSQDVNATLTNDLTNGLPLVSTVDIRGTVKILFIKITNIRTSSTCNIDYFLRNRTQTLDCHYSTKI